MIELAMGRYGNSFRGRTVLITGAARGLGRAIAHDFANAGASLSLLDMRGKELEGVRNGVAEKGHRASTFQVDVTDETAVQNAVRETIASFGGIDVLVNNAGIALSTPFLQISVQEWEKVVKVNLTSAVIVTKAVLPHMIEKKYGRIIMMASLSGKTGGVATGAHYSVSKGGMITLARQLAREFGQYGITVNAVAPAFVDTDILRDIGIDTPEKREAVAELNVIQRLATVEDVSNVVLFLASEESGFITGETINVDGGRRMD